MIGFSHSTLNTREQIVMTYNEAVQIYHEAHPDAEQPSRRIHGVWYLRNTNRFLARIGTRCRNVF